MIGPSVQPTPAEQVSRLQDSGKEAFVTTPEGTVTGETVEGCKSELPSAGDIAEQDSMQDPKGEADADSKDVVTTPRGSATGEASGGCNGIDCYISVAEGTQQHPEAKGETDFDKEAFATTAAGTAVGDVGGRHHNAVTTAQHGRSESMN